MTNNTENCKTDPLYKAMIADGIICDEKSGRVNWVSILIAITTAGFVAFVLIGFFPWLIGK